MYFHSNRARSAQVALGLLIGSGAAVGLLAAPRAEAQTPRVFRVEVTPNGGTVGVGQTLEFTGRALDRAGTVIPNVVFTFASNRTAIAGVTQLSPDRVRVTGVGTGTASITARGGGKTARVTVTVVPDGGPNVIAAGIIQLNHILVDGDFIYWVDTDARTNRVRRAPLTGGPAVDLVTEPRTDRRGVGVAFLQLQQIGNDIFYVRQASGFQLHYAIRAVPRTGGPMREVLLEDISVEPLLLTGWRAVGRFLVVVVQNPVRLNLSAETRVAVLDTTTGIWKSAITGRWVSTRAVILAANASQVFIRGITPTGQTEIVSLDPAGDTNSANTLFTGDFTERASQPGAVDAANLYFWSGVSDASLSLRALPLAGGAARTLTTGTVGFGVLSDGTNLFFARDPGVLFRLPVAGGTPTEVRRNLVIAPLLGGIAADAANFYLGIAAARNNISINRVPR